MDETEKKIKEILSQKLDVPNHCTNAIKTAFNKKTKNSLKFLKISAVICMCLLVTGGIGFAAKDYIKEILKDSFGLGKEVDIAVEHGYIENVDMDYVTSAVTIDGTQYVINTKITDFLMDDMNLSVHFDCEFADNLKEVLNIENLSNIQLVDLIVTDENNNIIFNNNKESFEKFCTENNLPYRFNEYNENYMNNGLNNFINYKNGNQITFTYNMYTDGTYPKSQKLNFYFTKIELKEEKKSNDEQNSVILEGDWNISVNVPEKMYNRQSISYKVISCSNENFDITTATLYEDRFELGAVISNMPEPDTSELMKFLEQHPEDVTKDKELSKQLEKLLIEWRPPVGEEYIENEKGEKFEVSRSSSARENCNYVGDDKLDLYTTFAMTKYEATDKLTIIITLKETPVIIELKKI